MRLKSLLFIAALLCSYFGKANAELPDFPFSANFLPGSFTGLTYELVASDGVTGFDTYRVYANFSDPNDQLTAVYGQDITPLSITTTGTFYQDPLGGPLATDVNPANYASFPSLEFDSWVTIGADAGPSALTSLGIDYTNFEAGGSLVSNDPTGGAWFVLPDNEPAAFPDGSGRVLIAQLTTDGFVSMTVNVQYRAADLTNPQEVGLTLNFPPVVNGCTDPTACNFNVDANTDDGSCVFASGCDFCSGETDGTGTVVDGDSDNDGVCDVDEIVGCQDPTACNFDASATDAGSCVFASGCDFCSGETDGTGTVVDGDSDNDGVCDVDEIVGCQDPTACNFDASATDAGSCVFASGCDFCSGETDGTGTVVDGDSDNDGVCDVDEIVGCQDPTACNFDASATDAGSCVFASGCDFCSGETDGTGTVVDGDSDNDGVCDVDEIAGCQDPTACNFNPSATDDDGSCEFTSCLTGCTYPLADNYDAAAVEDDGSCIFSGCTDPLSSNFNPLANNDDGSCVNEVPGCTYTDADNFDPAATVDDGTCTFTPAGPTCAEDINGDNVINTGDLTALLGAFGDTCP